MTQRDKTETVFSCVVLGFLVWGLMEEQKQQNTRLRALRKRLNAVNGLDTDIHQLRNDWQNIRSDLHKASDKAMSNAQ
jgi:hypothetical protein